MWSAADFTTCSLTFDAYASNLKSIYPPTINGKGRTIFLCIYLYINLKNSIEYLAGWALLIFSLEYHQSGGNGGCIPTCNYVAARPRTSPPRPPITTILQ